MALFTFIDVAFWMAGGVVAIGLGGGMRMKTMELVMLGIWGFVGKVVWAELK